MNTQLCLQPAYSESMGNCHIDRAEDNGLLPATRGKILRRKLSNNPDQIYYLYIPLFSKINAPVFIAVHGIRRRAEQHATHFAPFAEQYGCILIVPYFPEDRFRGYQRLGFDGKGDRADRLLDQIIAEVNDHTDANTEKLFMFGYSGGAQFVSRYMMIYPHRVARIALAAAGWYTYPDLLQDYPMGIKRIKDHREIKFDPMKILSIPTSVLVGEKDTPRDKELRKSKNIDKQQGVNRLERNRRWVKVMRASARAQKLNTPYDFQILSGSGHSFKECMQKGGMGPLVFNFLFAPACLAEGR